VSDPRPHQSLWTGPREEPRRYRVDLHDGLLENEGDGGEGLVYRATRTTGGAHDVALKMLTTLTVGDYERVAERARLMAQIEHPNVMRQIETFIGTALLDSNEPTHDDFDVVYSVAEWVPGASLAVAVEAAGPRAGLRWVAQIARAAAYLHAFRSPAAPDGVIHRDIKPSNVRIFHDRAVLIDFGVARPHDTSDLTQGVGTYLWRAPETVGGPGQPGPASDAWGVGALAYWALTGEPPRLEATAAVRERLTAVARELELPDPRGLSNHVAQLLETHPDDRPDDLNGWADELDALAAAPARSKRRRSSSASRQRKRVVAALAAALVAALAVGAVALTASGGSGTPRGAAISSTSTEPPSTTLKSVGGPITMRIVNSRTGEPFAEWANDKGALLRACPKIGCIDDGSINANDMYFGANANGEVFARNLDPAVEYDFTAMAVDVEGCPPYYQNPDDPRNANHKYWFAPEASGTPAEMEGTTFKVEDHC
jgi:serine/threonine protein kinase